MKRPRLFALGLIAAGALGVAATPATARPAYVSGIPNGSAVSCGACHVAAGGGGPRNDFGQDVEATMPFSGPNAETWSKLFCVDSDGDGQPNGQELGDPCGTWSPGDQNPGGPTSNPGDSASTTEANDTCDGAALETCALEPGGGGGCAAAGASPAVTGLGLLGGLLFCRRRRAVKG
jgi:hypothetical protein